MKSLVRFAFLFLSSIPAFAQTADKFIQDRRAESAPSQQAATHALATFQQLFTRMQTFSQPSFASKAEVDAAKLGTLQPIVIVPLQKLKEYTGPDPLVALTKTDRVIYPVGQVSPTEKFVSKSSVELLHRGEKWLTASVGGKNFARAVAEAIAAAHSSNLQVNESNTIIVEVPSLRLHFIAFSQDNVPGKPVLMFVPMTNAPAFGVVKGRKRAADAVLKDLVKWANQQTCESPS